MRKQSSVVDENVLSQFVPFGKSCKEFPNKTISDSSFGRVKPKVVLLVLAGCKTLLIMLSNRRLEYAEIDGTVSCGAMSNTKATHCRDQILVNIKEEVLFLALTVGDTIDFAACLKVSSHIPLGVKGARKYAQVDKEFLLRTMKFEHTGATEVGDAYICGISGGEKKRMSIV
jgi:ABC-type multidrug transport system ATPase subunit